MGKGPGASRLRPARIAARWSCALAAALAVAASAAGEAHAASAGAAPPVATAAELPPLRAADTPGPLPPASPEEGPDSVVRGANVARILFPAKATASPGSGRLLARIGPVAPLGGGEAQFAVTAQRLVGGRLFVRILLAQRPNGAAGWVSGDDVALLRTPWQLTIDLRARAVEVRRDGRRVKRFAAVVGAPLSPTPRGRFAVSELLPQRPATGFFGTWVLPLTAFSDTYTEYQGGPGRVAIHGRGGSSLATPLGTAGSHGCIRLANGDANWLANRIVPGVPVTIR